MLGIWSFILNLFLNMEDIYKYKSTIVATYVAALANERRVSVNMTKIQKLLYIAYGIYLAVKNSRLTNEHPQAWPYGPVFPTTRNKLQKKDLLDINLEDSLLDEIKNDEEINSLMELVFSNFGTMTAVSLSEWSHQEGSPWYYTVHAEKFKWGDTIPDDLIKDYFNKIITRKNG